jgi:geranylgeranyl pyrophosphate synthase
MDVLKYCTKTKPLIDHAIENLFPIFIEKMPFEHAEMLKQSIDGGKRTRGTLTCLFCEACGGNIKNAIPRAVAIEYIHAGTIIHDDYVDLDLVRRKRPAMWTLEGSRRAVLFGDLILSSMVNMMSEMSNEDVKAVAEAIATVARGALQEPMNPTILIRDITSGIIPAGLYDVIIKLKTGTLFGAAAKLGTIAANASTFGERAYDYGTRCGEAFQIADDVNDVRNIIKTSKADVNKMVTLVPAYLYFSCKEVPVKEILDLIAQNQIDITSMFSQNCDLLIRQMLKEIDYRRLQALEKIKDFPNNVYTNILRQAPSQMIRLALENQETR